MSIGIGFLSVFLGMVTLLGSMSCKPRQNPSSDLADYGQSPSPTAKTVTSRLGLGFNLGNVFDQAPFQEKNLAEVKNIIDLFYQVGFRHVRIPTTWMDGFSGSHLADANGNLDTTHPRFKELNAVIDYCLGKGMYVILNTHHEKWLKETYDGSDKFNKPFANLWTNIGKYYAKYPKTLIFEVLNEPDGAFGYISGDPPFKVNPYKPELLALTRKINKLGYDAIRASDARNKTRTVLIMPNAQGNISLLPKVYPDQSSLPGEGADAYLAMSVHSYDSWNFCGQEGSNTNDPGLDYIRNKVSAAANHAKTLGIALHIGEFGVGRIKEEDHEKERNTDVVRNYYNSMVDQAFANAVPATVWADFGWYRLVAKNPAAGPNAHKFLFNIAPTMAKNLK